EAKATIGAAEALRAAAGTSARHERLAATIAGALLDELDRVALLRQIAAACSFGWGRVGHSAASAPRRMSHTSFLNSERGNGTCARSQRRTAATICLSGCALHGPRISLNVADAASRASGNVATLSLARRTE